MNGRVEQQAFKRLILIEATTIVSLVPVALFQMNALDALPDPPLALFDSERIVSSDAAHPFGVPDAIVGIANFSFTLLLARSALESPESRELLAVKLVSDSAFAAFNMGRQLIQFRKLCSWCTATAVLALVAGAVGRDTIADSFGALRKTRPRTSHNKLLRMQS